MHEAAFSCVYGEIVAVIPITLAGENLSLVCVKSYFFTLFKMNLFKVPKGVFREEEPLFGSQKNPSVNGF